MADPIYGTRDPTLQDTQAILWCKICETITPAGLNLGGSGTPMFGTSEPKLKDTKKELMVKVLEKLRYV